MAKTKPKRISRTEGFLKWFFDFQAKDPRCWMGTAERLKLSADRLPVFNPEIEASLAPWFEKSLQEVSSMLVGMSIENMLKASRIANGETAIENGKLVPSLGHHGLNKLADGLNDFQRSEEDKFVLDELTQMIEWRGRYPTPKTDSKFTPTISRPMRHKLEQELWDRLWEYAAEKVADFCERQPPP